MEVSRGGYLDVASLSQRNAELADPRTGNVCIGIATFLCNRSLTRYSHLNTRGHCLLVDAWYPSGTEDWYVSW